MQNPAIPLVKIRSHDNTTSYIIYNDLNRPSENNFSFNFFAVQAWMANSMLKLNLFVDHFIRIAISEPVLKTPPHTWFVGSNALHV